MGSTGTQVQESRRWAARPWTGRALHAVGVGAPIGLAIVTGLVVGDAIGPPSSLAMTLVRLVTTMVVSIVVLSASDRVFRRLLPLAAMYRLTLVFPDQAPSRFSVALRTGNSRKLERQIEAIRAGEAPETDAQSYFETLLELSAALNRHDRLTRGHCERTRAYTEVVIRELDISSHDADRLRWASLLHDVGKLGVDAEILNKPGKPTEAEWEQLRAHPEIGARLAAPIADFLGPWISAIEEHHERWDGNGYPRGLAGRDIHLGGRIVAVADAYDVMTSARSYKRAMSPLEARKELVRCAGTQFDPDVVRAFLATSLGRARWSLASLGALVHLRDAVAILTAAPVTANVATAAGAVAMTTAAATGFGVIDDLGSVVPFVPSVEAEQAETEPVVAADDGGSGIEAFTARRPESSRTPTSQGVADEGHRPSVRLGDGDRNAKGTIGANGGAPEATGQGNDGPEADGQGNGAPGAGDSGAGQQGGASDDQGQSGSGGSAAPSTTPPTTTSPPAPSSPPTTQARSGSGSGSSGGQQQQQQQQQQQSESPSSGTAKTGGRASAQSGDQDQG